MDSGRHPDGWLKQRLSVLQEENSRAHGRVLALQEFKEQLIDRLKREEEGERGQFTSSLQQQMERKPMTIKLSLPTASNTEDEIIDI